jgi:hypothetical protein
LETAENKKHTGGRVANPLVAIVMKKYGYSYRRACRLVHDSKIDQLELCKDESARRLLLGKSRKGRLQ